jgi:hypothetical protein
MSASIPTAPSEGTTQATDEYRITVEGPDGEEFTTTIPADQVRFFGDESGLPFSTALWLAYTHAWAMDA